MGIVFGKSGFETPKYAVLKKADKYEIRRYEPQIVAEVTYEGDVEAGFRILANYIFGGNVCENETTNNSASKRKHEKIAMTAPVLTTPNEEPAFSSNADFVGKGKKSMTFVMPSKYTIDTLPKPVDPRIVIREFQARTKAVAKISGNPSDAAIRKKEEKIRKILETDGITVKTPASFAVYDPPYTLPVFRKNEIWFDTE